MVSTFARRQHVHVDRDTPPGGSADDMDQVRQEWGCRQRARLRS
ncbi:MAG: hypothetical protein ACT6FG_05335 [Methanosarcinaceae archaeon]